MLAIFFQARLQSQTFRLFDGLQPLETLPVAVNDAKFRMPLHWRLPVASSAWVAIAQADMISSTLLLLPAIFVASLARMH